MRKLSCAVLALLPLTAFGMYPIEVDSSLNGTEISYSTQEISNDMAVLLLANQGREPVRCSAVFRNGPEAPRTRKTLLQPGQEANLTTKFTRGIIKLRVKLECNPE